MPGTSNSGGQNKKSIAQLKADGTFRADRHGSYVDAKPNSLVKPAEFSRDEIFARWASRINAAGLGQEQDSVIANQLTDLTLAYNFAQQIFDQDPEAKIGNKLALTVMQETGKDVRMIMNDYRMSPGSRNPTVDEEKDDLGKFLDGPVQ